MTFSTTNTHSTKYRPTVTTSPNGTITVTNITAKHSREAVAKAIFKLGHSVKPYTVKPKYNAVSRTWVVTLTPNWSK